MQTWHRLAAKVSGDDQAKAQKPDRHCRMKLQYVRRELRHSRPPISIIQCDCPVIILQFPIKPSGGFALNVDSWLRSRIR